MKKADLKTLCRQFEKDIGTIQRRASIQMNARSITLNPRVQGATLVTGSGLVSFRRWGYSMLAVNLAHAWSDFAEAMFIGSVNRDPANVGKHLGLPLPKHLSYAVCEALFTARTYLDFRSVGELKGEGDKFLVTNPFKAIEQADQRRLDELSYVRNYVVHGSRRARKAYHDHVLKPNKYTNLVEPGTFLLGTIKGITRLEQYIKAAGSAAKSVEAAIK